MIAVATDIASLIAWIVLLWAGLVLSAYYSGMETGLYVLNKIRLDLRAESGEKRGRTLRGLLRDPNSFLAILLVGNNLANYATTFAVSGIAVALGRRQLAEALSMLVVTPTLFILGESVPKTVFRRKAEQWVYRMGWLLYVSRFVFRWTGLVPLVRGFAIMLMRVTRQQNRELTPLAHGNISAVVAEGRATGTITHFQSMMAERVVHIREVTLSDVMVPMSRVVWAERGVSRRELIDRLRGHEHSRLPLLDERKQVVGVVNVYDVLMLEDTAPAEKARPPLILPEEMTVTDALYRMRRARSPMAIVRARDGEHVGIATIKDLVEEIVGELEEW
ncbi:MAG: CNNM domain-containing protein [Phycisphaerae bacterium]